MVSKRETFFFNCTLCRDGDHGEEPSWPVLEVNVICFRNTPTIIDPGTDYPVYNILAEI